MGNSNNKSNNTKEVHEVIQVNVIEESNVQEVEESHAHAHVHTQVPEVKNQNAKEIIHQITEVNGVHEAHKVIDVNIVHTPPRNGTINTGTEGDVIRGNQKALI